MNTAKTKKTSEGILRDLVFDDKGAAKMPSGYDARIPVRLPAGKAVEVWFTQRGTLNFSHPIRKRNIGNGLFEIAHQVYYFSKEGEAKEGKVLYETLEV